MEPPPCQPKQYKATRSPAHCRPLVTMKAVLLTLLAVSLALRPGETSATMGPGHGNRAGGGGGQSGETRGALREGTHPEGQREEVEVGGRGEGGQVEGKGGSGRKKGPWSLPVSPSGAALSVARVQ